MIVTQLSYTLVADGSRSYTFEPQPSGDEVVVWFQGPRHNTVVVTPTQEARVQLSRLLKRGYERW